MNACRNKVVEKCSVVEYASDEKSMTKIWEARKNALNSIMKLTVGSRRPIGLIEDTVVHPICSFSTMLPTSCPEYTVDGNEPNYVMYGHVGDGNLHTRPLQIDTSSMRQVELMGDIAREVFAHVIRKGGTITGEHGEQDYTRQIMLR